MARSYLTKLHYRDPRCHWCDIQTTVGPKGPMGKGRMAKNLATLDHLFSRGHCIANGLRYKDTANVVVLACYDCNFTRNNAEQKNRSLYKKVKNDWLEFRADGSVGIGFPPMPPEQMEQAVRFTKRGRDEQAKFPASA